MALLDTHIWAWSLAEPSNLSSIARQRLAESDLVIVSAVTFYEISLKVHLDKWPQMIPYMSRLPDLAQEQSVYVAPVTAELALLAGSLNWAHRDPFDRHLAATALKFGVDLISADKAFDSLPGLRRIW